jgi:hypothetical protein
MYQESQTSLKLYFLFMNFVWPSLETAIILNSINHLILVTVKCCALSEVRTEFLNNIHTAASYAALPM